MPRQEELRVLVATDGSRQAWAAVATAALFPWSVRTQVRVVVAADTRLPHRRSILLAALDRGADQAAANAQRALSGRWPSVDVRINGKTAVHGILDEAKRFRANVIVVGWRGHGAVRRLLMGSVSRGVVRSARCSVLVVRRPQRIRRILIGVDGSAGAKSALAFVSRLAPPPRGQVTLVHSQRMMPVPTHRLIPKTAGVAAEVKRRNAEEARTAMKYLDRAARDLKRHGWPTRSVLVHGEPLRELIRAVASSRADLLVVGARSTGGISRLLLGSVAEGALNRSPVAVLIAR